nr:zinc ABC transporter ATP-binding protein AztA [Marinactinospora thermotolerans]
MTASYGKRTVLHDVSAEIPAHQVTALVGPNGSGKSTLLALLAGVHPPDTGTVHRHHRARPALVLQRSAVSDALPLTVRETVAMGRWSHLGPIRRFTKHDRAVVETCMERMGIADLAGRPLGALSGGQRQRALLAQGLAQESDLLLLDEPATGLDAASRDTMADVLAGLGAEGVTVVHATHDADAARQAGHRLVLSEGRLSSRPHNAAVAEEVPSATG